MHSDGGLKYSIARTEQKPVLGEKDLLTSGIINYSFLLDKGTIKVQDFKLRSGPLDFSAIGQLAGFKSQNPMVSFTVQTGEFKIEKTRQYLPLMFFSESVHRDLNQRFNNGTLQVKALNFDGSLEQLKILDLKKNKSLFDAEIVFKKVDWRSPLPPLKKVTGYLQYKNGNGYFKITKARFKDLPIVNLQGVVHSMMNNPVADLSLNNELELKATDESSKIHPSSIYGITKQHQEQLMLLTGKALHIPTVALRFQNVYGPGQSLSNPYTGILSIFSTRILNENNIDIYEDGKESRDFIYIDDAVDATILALEKREANHQIFNVGSGVATSVFEVANILKKLYNYISYIRDLVI